MSTKVMELTHLEQQRGQTASIPYPPKPRKNVFLFGLAGGTMIIYLYSLYQLQLDYTRLAKGLVSLFKVLGQLFPPDVSGWKEALSGALLSVETAIVGTVFSIFISFFLAFLAADNFTPHPLLGKLLKALASFIRSIPMLVWVLIFIVAVGMGPFPGILAIMTHAVGMLIKVYAQSIEEVDEGMIEALRSTGATWLQIIGQCVLPNIRGSLLSWSALRFEFDMGDSVIMGAVGAGGIGWVIEDNMRMYLFNAAFFDMIIIFLIVFTIEAYVSKIKGRVNQLNRFS